MVARCSRSRRRRTMHAMRMTTLTKRTVAALAVLGLGSIMLLASPGAHAADSTAKVAVTFDGAKLTGFPAKLKGGLTEITLTNTGKFGIDLELLSLVGTHTDAEYVAARHSDTPPKWVEGRGGVASTAARSSNSVTANLDKGTYVWSVSSNGSELDGKEPLGRFAVTSAKSTAPLPGGAASISTKEYGFDTKGLKAGVNTVSVSNKGKEWHHVIMAKITAGKTIEDLKKELTSNLQGPPQTIDQSTQQFLPMMNPGVSYVTKITLQPGTYGFVCFMPDAKGKPHVMDGMVQEVKIA